MIKLNVSVVVPTFNRKDLLKNTLESLTNQSYPKERYEIIIVDSSTIRGVGEIISEAKKSHTNIKHIKIENKSPATSRNLGIKNATGRIVAFIDDDCIANEHWLKKILESFESHDAQGIEGKTETIPDRVGPFTSQVVNENGGGYMTCNIAYKKEILDKVGGFDNRYPFPHNEDADLAWRVIRYGKIYFEPGALVVHPPRPISVIELIRRVRYLESEFRLHHKFPERYMFRSPFITFSHFMFFTFFNELEEKKSFLKKEPLIYLKYVLVLLLQRTYLLLLIPLFYVKHFKTKYD